LALLKKLDLNELVLLEILEHPVLNPEFLRKEVDPLWEHTPYQRLVLADCGNFVSFRASRAIGKTETLIDKVIYFAVNDFFPSKVMSIVTPNRIHLSPIWRRLLQWLGSHPFLQHFRHAVNSQIYDLQFANDVTLDCRIAGIQGTGSTVIGLHTSFLVVEEAGFLNWQTWVELLPTINNWELGFQVFVCGTPSGERENNVLYFTDEISTQYNRHRVSSFENPRYTEEAKQRDIEQYGGEDSDDYQRLVLGEHASPVVRLFSRETINTSKFPMFTATISNKDLEEDPTKILRLFDSLPQPSDIVACGIDLGYVDPTVISIFKLVNDVWLNFARITLEQIEYPKQLTFLDRLDTYYGFSFLAIDEGHSGLIFSQELTSGKYAHKGYDKRLIPLNFGQSVELGTDLDGNVLKAPSKNLSVEKLRSLLDTKKLAFSENDDKLLSELERVESINSPSGKAIFRVRTPGGGLRGEDHIFASLLCFSYALYIREDYSVKQKHVRLLGGRWSRR
jgi:hypothetical protein